MTAPLKYDPAGMLRRLADSMPPCSARSQALAAALEVEALCERVRVAEFDRDNAKVMESIERSRSERLAGLLKRTADWIQDRYGMFPAPTIVAECRAELEGE